MVAMSSRDVKPGGGDDGHHVIGGQGVGGYHRPLRGLKEIVVSMTSGLAARGAIHAAGAAPQVMPLMVR